MTHSSLPPSVKSGIALFALLLITGCQIDKPSGTGPSSKTDEIPQTAAEQTEEQLTDISHAGYKGGGVAIPEIPATLTLAPAQGDNSQYIQNAIDQISALDPDETGFRGTLLLKQGSYKITETLSIKTGGIILRGQSQDETGTILILSGNHPKSLIEIGGNSSANSNPITQVGIEHLRIVTETESTNAPPAFISINNAQNIWLRNLTALDSTSPFIHTGTNTESITIQDSIYLGNNNRPFDLTGKRTLVQRCYSASGFKIEKSTSGSNVFLDCSTAEIQSFNIPAKPEGLYLRQLRERLGPAAVENISEMDIRAPIRISPDLWN